MNDNGTPNTTADDFQDNTSIRSGRQKVSKANANSGATTLRIKYAGINNLQLAASAQYQQDLSQGSFHIAHGDDKPSAILREANAIFTLGDLELRGLYAQWNIEGDYARSQGIDKQKGAYVQAAYKITDKVGLFMRTEEWDKEAGSRNTSRSEFRQNSGGVNYWPHEQVVVKFDVVSLNSEKYGDDDDAKDGFNVGLGYSF